MAECRQSEEGGRFYRDTNVYRIVDAGVAGDAPTDHFWLIAEMARDSARHLEVVLRLYELSLGLPFGRAPLMAFGRRLLSWDSGRRRRGRPGLPPVEGRQTFLRTATWICATASPSV